MNKKNPRILFHILSEFDMEQFCPHCILADFIVQMARAAYSVEFTTSPEGKQMMDSLPATPQYLIDAGGGIDTPLPVSYLLRCMFRVILDMTASAGITPVQLGELRAFILASFNKTWEDEILKTDISIPSDAPLWTPHAKPE